MKINLPRFVALGLALALVSVACVVLGLWLFGSVAHSGLNLSINGEPVVLPELQGWHWMAASTAGLMLAMLLVLAVPLVLALALTLAGLGVFVAVAALLMPLGLVVLIATSPLWVVAWVLWWALRRKTAPADTMPV